MRRNLAVTLGPPAKRVEGVAAKPEIPGNELLLDERQLRGPDVVQKMDQEKAMGAEGRVFAAEQVEDDVPVVLGLPGVFRQKPFE